MQSTPMVGTEFGPFVIEGLIGRGGMGVVYRAEQRYPRRKIALKILAAELALDEDFRERFVREWTSAAIDHPNIVPIYQAGLLDGRLYIAMRFVEGADLGALIKRHGQLEADRAIWIVQQVAGALQAAHARGLVHRDVKPANILVASGQGSEPADHAYLSDFGLTQETQARDSSTGQLVGTVDYMAPEQIEGDAVDARADIYSLACVLFETLAGQPPYPRPNQVAVIHAHLTDPIPMLSAIRPDLGQRVDSVIGRAMAKRSDDRYSSCADFMTAVREALQLHLQPRRPEPVPAATESPDPVLLIQDGGTIVEPSPVGSPPPGKTGRWRSFQRRWVLVAGIAALLGVSLILLFSLRRSSPPATKQGAPQAGSIPKLSIAFASSRSGNMDIYSMLTDGTGIRNLTSSPAEDAGPAWSPDGSKIVFASNRYGNADLLIMNADGTSVSRLTFDPGNEVGASWSPDGSLITFTSDRDGNHEIYVVGARGSPLVNMTNSPADEEQSAWSPDGTRIAFVSNRSGTRDIFVMKPDGTDVVQLTSDLTNEAAPAWSPDGRKIAFTVLRSGSSDIWVMNADGSDRVRLTQDAARDLGPQWSPDSLYIGFQSDRDGNRELYLIKSIGSPPLRLTNDPGDDATIVFQPHASSGPGPSSSQGAP